MGNGEGSLYYRLSSMQYDEVNQRLFGNNLYRRQKLDLQNSPKYQSYQCIVIRFCEGVLCCVLEKAISDHQLIRTSINFYILKSWYKLVVFARLDLAACLRQKAPEGQQASGCCRSNYSYLEKKSVTGFRTNISATLVPAKRGGNSPQNRWFINKSSSKTVKSRERARSFMISTEEHISASLQQAKASAPSCWANFVRFWKRLRSL